MDRLRYAVVTPVRNEVDNLRRLAGSLDDQAVAPTEWIIVETGSTDETAAVAESLSSERMTIRVAFVPAPSPTQRGAPIVRAFEYGAGLLDEQPDIVVKVDADVSFEPEYFERLLAAFADDPALGIASGSAKERTPDGVWERRHNTGGSVWGAARAYRWDCLRSVRPLEQRMGWDGIDEMKAHVLGWRTATLPQLTFFHHRREGGRDRSKLATWIVRGRDARYMGYRPTYLAARAAYQARNDPAALVMLWGYAAAAVRREPKHPDREIRAFLRGQQRLRNLGARRREALGMRPEGMSP